MRNRETVLNEIRNAVLDERKSQLQVLFLLREIESDGHYLEMGYSSLFEFTTQCLKYSAGAAHRRIQSMRFVRSFPEMEAKVEQGSLSLCTAAKTQTFFKNEDQRRKKEGKEKLSKETKRAIAQPMVGASTKECEKKLAAISPASAHPPEKKRELSHGKTLIQFSADAELMERLESLKGLLAHRNPGGSFEGLFKILAEIALKSVTPKPPKAADAMETVSRLTTQKAAKNNAVPASSSTDGASAVKKLRSRAIPVEIKRRVFARDEGKCTFRDPKTGHRCSSRFALEFDHHKMPFAWGGKSSEDNLTLRCRAHNAYSARVLGLFPGRLSMDAIQKG